MTRRRAAEVTVVEIGPMAVSAGSGDAADLAVFVDRLAAAGSDRPTALAHGQIRRAIEGGTQPPGLRRLAEALAASVSGRGPAPQRPSEDSGSLVPAVARNPLVVCEDFGPESVAAALTALLADGRRVVV
ncbi:MAG TPA: hypothetical protein VD813_16190, partial [Pseudonocardia sp.]|nr:hypothetical protein [Pseudonocardia sp.]